MARNAFYSFHYKPDCSRASLVRNMGVIEGNQPVSDNDWETVTKGGDKAIQKWIDDQLKSRSCAIVLIGENTANRKWINHEIVTAWDQNKGVLGVHIHRLKDFAQLQSQKGVNPFDYIMLGSTGKRLSTVVPVFDPPYSDSKDVYAYIKTNLADWIEKAISVRSNN
jgi:hypothetical protein